MRVLLIAALAAMSTSPSTSTAQEPKKPDVAALVKDLTRVGDKKTEAAIDALEKIGLPAFDVLLDALPKADEGAGAAIVTAMGRLRHVAIKQGNAVAADAIEKVLLDALRDRREYVTNCVAFALTEKDPRCKKVLPILIDILKDQKKGPDARTGARTGLINLGTDAAAAIPVLLDIVADKEAINKIPQKQRPYYQGDRLAALWVLAKVGPKDERVLSVLKKSSPTKRKTLECGPWPRKD
jgi:hypothetical protein